MTRLRQIGILLLCLAGLRVAVRGQSAPESLIIIQPLTEQGWAEWDLEHDRGMGTNGVVVKYAGAVLTADRVTVDQKTGEAIADGHVRIQREDEIWVSEHVRYNFFTRRIDAEHFRTGKPPVFAEGDGLHVEVTNHIYAATNAMVTTDDIAQPTVRLRAKYIKIIPGKRIEARHATLYVGGVPMFYFPYYSRNLGPRANNLNAVPGYRSLFGPYLLGSYNWFLDPTLDGTLHLDYRQKRGVGLGPDVNYHLGPWGDGTFKYYYAYDLDPNADIADAHIPSNRQRVYLAYQAQPTPTLAVKSLVRYQSDTNLIREFFEPEYREDPQPNTFVEVNKFWRNFSLDAYVQPRLNSFLDTVERLPDVRLTGFRQQIAGTPLYYESESSLGYYRQLFAQTNSMPTGMDYAAGRADTYHELLLPQTFFGWLNVTPRIGGRFTYYTEASGDGAATNRWSEAERGVLNTGVEVSFKASRTWAGLGSDLLDVDGLRHILQPSVNYVFVPHPTVPPRELPQFDTDLPSLEMLPVEYPEYDAIDAIDTRNVVRLGLGNKLQTKRNGAVVDMLNWQLYTDWRLNRSQSLAPPLSQFSDIYSDLQFKPRSWLALESKTRFDIADDQWRMALHTFTIQPNDVWSWSVGHFYVADDPTIGPTSLGIGNNLIINTIFYRLNEDWGFRASHYFEARTGVMQEQAYTVYRDLRSWTAALTFRQRDNPGHADDFTVAFTFSLKSFPRFGVGEDTRQPYTLWGGY